MNIIETALRSYRYLLTHKHPEEKKQIACCTAALEELSALAAHQMHKGEGQQVAGELRERILGVLKSYAYTNQPATKALDDIMAIVTSPAAPQSSAEMGEPSDTEMLDWLAGTCRTSKEINGIMVLQGQYFRDAIAAAMRTAKEKEGAQ